MDRSKSLLLSVVVVVLAGAAGWYALSHQAARGGVSGPHASSTVAMVNGTAITHDQLLAAESQLAAQQGATSTAAISGNPQVQAAALNALIGQTLLKQAVQKAGVTASSTEVDKQLAAVASQFKTKAQYQKALTSQGLTQAKLRSQISEKVATNDFLNQQLHLSDATATDAEIQAAYNKVAAQQSNVPPLAQVRSQVAQLVVQQKQQKEVAAYVAQLRAQANVQVFISTSTAATSTSV